MYVWKKIITHESFCSSDKITLKEIFDFMKKMDGRLR